MIRYALFVDGSNLFGSLKSMNVEVKEYDAFYAYIYKEAIGLCREVTLQDGSENTQLRRVYWYSIGTMDEWNLNLPQSQASLRGAFDKDKTIHSYWLERVGKTSQGIIGKELEEKTWIACLENFKVWYEEKKHSLEGMRKFYAGVRTTTNGIDIIEKGHWKVNFLHKTVEEKGLDTALSVDMIAFQENFDIGIIVSGDADAIPSIKVLKEKNKIIGAVEFVNGSPPESKGRTFSSRLKEHADFVLRIYESEILRLKLGAKPK
jgi:uncharacterized LabA/DUF88 family protein